MPYDNNGKYYLNDVEHSRRASELMIEPVYQQIKEICERDMRTQEAFEGLVRFLEDCGYTMQKSIIKVLKGEN